jgi:hypothetical protein
LDSIPLALPPRRRRKPIPKSPTPNKAIEAGSGTAATLVDAVALIDENGVRVKVSSIVIEYGGDDDKDRIVTLLDRGPKGPLVTEDCSGSVIMTEAPAQ